MHENFIFLNIFLKKSFFFHKLKTPNFYFFYFFIQKYMDHRLLWIELGLGLIWGAEPIKICHGAKPHRIKDLSSPIFPPLKAESAICREWNRHGHLSLLLSCPPPWTLTTLVLPVVPSNPIFFTAQSSSLLPNSEWRLFSRRSVTVAAPAAHQRWKIFTPDFSKNVDSCCDGFQNLLDFFFFSESIELTRDIGRVIRVQPIQSRV